MTDEYNNAKELAKKLRASVMSAPIDIDSVETMAPILAAALAARERAVWLEAAKLADIYADCMEEDLPHNERLQRLTQQITAQTIAKRCRQQAEGVKP